MWAPIPAQQFTSCVALGKALALSEPSLICKMELITGS